MSPLHKLKSSLGNPVQKVTANTSQLRLSLIQGIVNSLLRVKYELAVKLFLRTGYKEVSFQSVQLSHSLQLRAGPF